MLSSCSFRVVFVGLLTAAALLNPASCRFLQTEQGKSVTFRPESPHSRDLIAPLALRDSSPDSTSLKFVDRSIVALSSRLTKVTNVFEVASQYFRNQQSGRRRQLTPISARVLLVACSIMYGSNYITTKFLQDAFRPSSVCAIRFFVGFLFFIPAFFTRKLTSSIFWGGVELGVWCAFGFIAQATALEKASASKVAFFCGLSVIMPPIFELLRDTQRWLRGNRVSVPKTEKHGLMKMLPSAMALAGASMIEWGGMEAPHASDLVLLVTPMSFALCFWRSERLHSKHHDLSPSLVTGIMIATVAAISAVWALFSKDVTVMDIISPRPEVIAKLLDWRISSGIIYTGAMTTAWTAYVEQRALRVLSAAETTLIYSLEPLFAMAFASFFLQEKITTNVILGGVCILAACLWDSLPGPSTTTTSTSASTQISTINSNAPSVIN